MSEAGAAAATIDAPVSARLPNPALLHLLGPKWLTARARARSGERGRYARTALLAGLGVIFWGFIFGVLYRLLAYFRGVQEIGPLLAGKLLGVILISFLSILLLSNVITALSSFFLAKDLDLLVAAPVDWLRLYGAKLLETAVHSSWMVVLLAVPMFAAYGVVYSGGWAFPLLILGLFVPFLLIPTVIGSAVTLLLVNLFPARRTRDILSVIAILRTPTSPFLPSEWVQQGVMSWLKGSFDPLPLVLLWSTAGSLIVLGALLHSALYPQGFSKAQESGQRWARAGILSRFGNWLLAPVGVVRRELLLKELRLFFRDTTQWSQLILLAVLVVVYVFNIKYLPLKGEGITFFLRNVVPFLNLVLAGFVIASVAARFIFPGVSLEGRTLWLLRSSPMPMTALLWAKFWVGTVPLLVLAVGIVGVTDALLQVSPFMFAVSLLTITMMTLALASLALGIGTLFPQFDTENAAQIPTSFGGLVFMMTAVALIAGTVVLEARPVYAYLRAKTYGTPLDGTEMIVGFGLATALCIAATLVPLRVARLRLEAVER
jgi:ABC-2 type transport system permease protein